MLAFLYFRDYRKEELSEQLYGYCCRLICCQAIELWAKTRSWTPLKMSLRSSQTKLKVRASVTRMISVSMRNDTLEQGERAPFLIRARKHSIARTVDRSKFAPPRQR